MVTKTHSFLKLFQRLPELACPEDKRINVIASPPAPFLDKRRDRERSHPGVHHPGLNMGGGERDARSQNPGAPTWVSMRVAGTPLQVPSPFPSGICISRNPSQKPQPGTEPRSPRRNAAILTARPSAYCQHFYGKQNKNKLSFDRNKLFS